MDMRRGHTQIETGNFVYNSRQDYAICVLTFIALLTFLLPATPVTDHMLKGSINGS